MNIWTDLNNVSRIRSRYFHGYINEITHSMDCSIYSHDGHGQRGHFCDCGLLHDLRWIDYGLAEVLYEKYEQDLYLHEIGEKKPKVNIEEYEKTMKILEAAFGPVEKSTKEDIEEQYDYMKKVLRGVFPDDFTNGYKRLDAWYKNTLKENNI